MQTATKHILNHVHARQQMECHKLLLAMIVYKIKVIESRELTRTDIWGSWDEMIFISIFDNFWQVNVQLSVHVVCYLLRIFYSV